VIKKVPVDATGAWSYREKNAPVRPGSANTISLRSSVGGVRLAVPVNVRS
jgi:hypothetical protein